MNKIVIFQSAEYFALIDLGWIVLEVISPTQVVMSQIGNVGRAKPPTTIEPEPPDMHTWLEMIRFGPTTVNEMLILYVDTASAGPVSGGYHYFKLDIYRTPFTTLSWSTLYHDRWEDANIDYNFRQVVAAFDTWTLMQSKAIGGPGTVFMECLAPSVPGDMQFRIRYSTGVIHLHTSFTPAQAEYTAAV